MIQGEHIQVAALGEEEENEALDEVPPFALVSDDDDSPTQSLFGLKVKSVFGSPNPTSRACQPAANNLPPGLVSSMVSCQTDYDGESQSSSVISAHESGQFLQVTNDRLLQATNDRIYPVNPPSLLTTKSAGDASHLLHSCEWEMHQQQEDHICDSSNFLSAAEAASATERPPGSASIGFSQLMDFADNANDHIAKSRILPVLQEEPPQSYMEREAGSTTLFTPNSSIRMENKPHWPGADDVLGWLPISASKFTNIIAGGSAEGSQQEYVGLRTSRLHSSPVEVAQIDHDTFQVAVYIEQQRSFRDVMDILGNPDMLRLWCDPVRSLVVIKSSEGARHTSNQTNNREDDREYEGEWIEATTMDLVSPDTNLTSMYSAGRAFWNCVGFPSYGNVTMFVERPKGRVGLTIGPFVGQITASHTITVQVTDTGRLLITDRVQLRQEEVNSNSVFFCGVASCVEKCFLPSVDGYMAQMALSMRRLRILVENGDRIHHHANNNIEQSSFCGEGTYIPPCL